MTLAWQSKAKLFIRQQTKLYMEKLRIVYMGTPDFAVESLKALVEAGKEIVGVVTMPDKPAGRGHKIQFSPVKEYALSTGLRLLQPENLKSPDFLEELRSLRADLQIVVAFRMLPEAVWSMPCLGTFNLHASLLPQYRGAAPINRAVINGERETGVTTFFLKHEIDTGNIIMQEKTPIADDDTAGSLRDRLMQLGSRLVLRTVNMIESGNVITTPQPQAEVKPAPKIFKETCRMDFSRTCGELRNFVRGLAPYPAAWTEWEDSDGNTLMMKIFGVTCEPCHHDCQPGTHKTDGKSYLKIAVRDGYIHLTDIQMAGKRRMKTEELLRGRKFDTLHILQ